MDGTILNQIEAFEQLGYSLNDFQMVEESNNSNPESKEEVPPTVPAIPNALAENISAIIENNRGRPRVLAAWWNNFVGDVGMAQAIRSTTFEQRQLIMEANNSVRAYESTRQRGRDEIRRRDEARSRSRAEAQAQARTERERSLSAPHHPAISIERRYDVDHHLDLYAMALSEIPSGVPAGLENHEAAWNQLQQITTLGTHFQHLLMRRAEAYVTLEEGLRLVRAYNRPIIVELFRELGRREDTQSKLLYNLHSTMKVYCVQAVVTLNRDFIATSAGVVTQI